MTPDDYSLPSPDGAPAAPFLTCFRACSPTSAWFMVSGQGLAPAGAIYQIMSHRDVQATLRSLDATHHVVTVGDTPRLLEPLTGRKLEPGEAPMLLPVCDCGLLSEALDQLRSELGALVVQVRQAAATYRSRAATYPLDIPGSQQVCMRLMASIWTQLVGDRQIRVSTLAQKNWWMMMLDQGKALTEFAGVMVLYGDHWALWNKIQALQQQLS